LPAIYAALNSGGGTNNNTNDNNTSIGGGGGGGVVVVGGGGGIALSQLSQLVNSTSTDDLLGSYNTYALNRNGTGSDVSDDTASVGDGNGGVEIVGSGCGVGGVGGGVINAVRVTQPPPSPLPLPSSRQ
jgi:hypothetical protein